MSGSRVVLAVTFSCFLIATSSLPSHAQSNQSGQSTAWAAAAIAHDQKMRMFPDVDHGSQPTPPVIPALEFDLDPTGLVSTYQTGGATITSQNPFFQNLGTNGRTCFTCHQPQTGWTISAQSAHDRFFASGGSDPLFRLVDGATCPNDDVSTFAAQQKARALD